MYAQKTTTTKPTALLRRQDGVVMIAVIMMLMIMSVVAVSMYNLLSATINVSSGFHRKTTTRSVAATNASMLMQVLATSVTSGTVMPLPGLVMNDAEVLADMIAGAGNDIMVDTPDNDPDFTYQFLSPMGNLIATARADVDYLQTIYAAGGSVEFASAYDGVGNGQTLGSSYVVETYVHIRAENANGSSSEIRFIFAQ